MRLFLIFTGLILFFRLGAQENINDQKPGCKFQLGVSAGVGGSYTDKAFLLNLPASINIDYRISDNYFLQFTPGYLWLIRWNEHYLNLSLHAGRKFGNRFNLFLGPALTFDVGFFHDLGVSFGADYQLSERSSIMLSSYTFTLYDYHIDYFFMPLKFSYIFLILK